VTVGRDTRGGTAIAAKVNDVIKLDTGQDATFTDLELAGQRLGSLLDTGPPGLLVLDDVWHAEQLSPFVEGGQCCARLVTTRVPSLLAGRGEAIQVDQMAPQQAFRLLTSGALMTGSPASAGRCADAAVTNWLTSHALEGCPLLVVAGM
jgi:NB-ARC domain